MTLHRIRLGPPWESSDTDGRARHARRFGRPRTLDPGERAWLVCAAVPGPGEVFVNGERVGAAEAGQPFAADITALLQPRNEVVVETTPGPLGEVALEFRKE